MKVLHIILALVLSYTGMSFVVADERSDSVDLHTVEATVGQLLEQDHYTQRKLDPNIAKQILDTYLESLDGNRLFFTQEDIDQIRNEYGPGLDDDILLGNLTSAKNIYALFRQRVDQRVAKNQRPLELSATILVATRQSLRIERRSRGRRMSQWQIASGETGLKKNYSR